MESFIRDIVIRYMCEIECIGINFVGFRYMRRCWDDRNPGAETGTCTPARVEYACWGEICLTIGITILVAGVLYVSTIIILR